MAQEIKIGTIIEVKTFTENGEVWISTPITKISDTYIWFKGSGYQRLKKSTINKYPELYRLLN